MEAEAAARRQSEAEGRRWIAELEESLAALEAERAAAESPAEQADASLEARRQIEDLSGRLQAAEMFLAESEKLRRSQAKELADLREELAARPEAAAAGGGAPAEVPPADPPGPSGEAAILEMVDAWARAWSTQAVEDYLSFYSSSFEPQDGQSREAWEAARRRRLRAPSRISIGVALVDLRRPTADLAEVEFVQSYTSDQYRDSVVKTLGLVLESGAWKIARETSE